MPAADFDFICEQGSTFKRDLILTNEADDSAVNLAGYSVRMDVRLAKTKNSDLLIQLNSSNSRAVVSDASAGKITLNITSTDTTSLTPGEYFFDLEIANSSSPPVVDRILEGTFTVNGEVTG